MSEDDKIDPIMLLEVLNDIENEGGSLKDGIHINEIYFRLVSKGYELQEED